MMTQNWKKCSDPEHSKIHPRWFNLDYFFSEYGVYCLSDDCHNCMRCSLKLEDAIAQYSQDAKVHYSTDRGKTKQVTDVNAIPSRIEFMTLLVQERIELLRKRQTK